MELPRNLKWAFAALAVFDLVEFSMRLPRLLLVLSTLVAALGLASSHAVCQDGAGQDGAIYEGRLDRFYEDLENDYVGYTRQDFEPWQQRAYEWILAANHVDEERLSRIMRKEPKSEANRHAVVLVTRICGRRRLATMAPVLIEKLNFTEGPHRFFLREPLSQYPCVTALRKIGSPSVSAIIACLKTGGTDDVTLCIDTLRYLGVSGAGTIESIFTDLQSALAECDNPDGRELLQCAVSDFEQVMAMQRDALREQDAMGVGGAAGSTAKGDSLNDVMLSPPLSSFEVPDRKTQSSRPAAPAPGAPPAGDERRSGDMRPADGGSDPPATARTGWLVAAGAGAVLALTLAVIAVGARFKRRE